MVDIRDFEDSLWMIILALVGSTLVGINLYKLYKDKQENDRDSEGSGIISLILVIMGLGTAGLLALLLLSAMKGELTIINRTYGNAGKSHDGKSASRVSTKLSAMKDQRDYGAY